MMNRKKALMFLGVAIVLIFAMFFTVIFVGKNKADKENKMTVGLMLTGASDDSGRNNSHYDGISAACRELELNLVVRENVAADHQQCRKAIDEIVGEGAKMIFLSSFGYAEAAADIIESYPDIQFFCVSDNKGIKNMKSYFARMYQTRYLSGIIAASMSETGSVGYAAAEENNEIIRGINAFALGARSVDPDVKINVLFTGEWSDKEKEYEAVKKLVNDYNSDVITYHHNLPYSAEQADKLGVYSIGYQMRSREGFSEKNLTSIVCNWRNIYYEIIRDVCQNNRNTPDRYWLGLDRGAEQLTEYSSLVSDEAKKAVSEAESRIKDGWVVFSGTIYDNEGNIRCSEDEAISDSVLFSGMEWLVEGVNVCN